jgi:pimeloyl-ACP methyl ester carboxylesterase
VSLWLRLGKGHRAWAATEDRKGGADIGRCDRGPGHADPAPGARPRARAAAALDAFISIRRHDLRPDLAKITCPATVVYGLRDQVRLPSHAQELAAGISGSELIASDSGHSSPLEDPVTIQRALARLAARVTAALDSPPA